MIAICCCYVVVGLGASFSYAISSSSLPGLENELSSYFECELSHHGRSCGKSCSRSEFEQFLNPGPKILGYCLLALYPTITLVYFLRKRSKTQVKQTVSRSTLSTSL